MKKLALAGALFCSMAFADHGGANQDAAFSSGVIGSMPNQTIAGVPSGGAPWVVREGKASLGKNGKLKVEVEGLLIAAGTLANGNPVPANLVGTVGPVQNVAASLVCNGMVVGSTMAAPLSVAGDAEMEGRISVQSCMSPSVLVRIVSPTTGQPGAFIALSGSSMMSDNAGVRQSEDVADDHGSR